MIKMHAGWLGGALFALGLATASAQSGEITGCLGDRGTLTKVAPGARPAAPCGANARKVSVPVALNAGKSGSARVDTYTFWKDINSDTADPFEGEEVFWLSSRHVGFFARCLLQRAGDGRWRPRKVHRAPSARLAPRLG